MDDGYSGPGLYVSYPAFPPRAKDILAPGFSLRRTGTGSASPRAGGGSLAYQSHRFPVSPPVLGQLRACPQLLRCSCPYSGGSGTRPCSGAPFCGSSPRFFSASISAASRSNTPCLSDRLFL
jgi:hypothetical protein